MRFAFLLALTLPACVSLDRPDVPPPTARVPLDAGPPIDARPAPPDASTDAGACAPCAPEATRVCPRAEGCADLEMTCEAGCWPPCPTPFAGRAERCDGADDDCDGRVDEGFNVGTPCRVGRGICMVEALIACDGRGGWLCPGEPGPAQQEVCSAEDEDCDGRVDEHLECPVCDDERCNDLDDDCDGLVDEGFDLGAACSVGAGVCAVAGVLVCADPATAVCAATPGEPSPERCNTLDDDCDGEVDEGVDPAADGDACERTLLACRADGRWVCDEMGAAVCDAPALTAEPETCNGRDDDCDGEVDVRRCPDGPGTQICDADRTWAPCVE